MIKSMTGYGSAEKIGCEKRITVEIRSVNHRYSDINIKTPRAYAFAEDCIRKTLGTYVTRGKVDVFLGVEGISGDTGEVLVNRDIAQGYYDALTSLAEEFHTPDGVTLSLLSRFSDVFKVVRPEEDTEALQTLITDTVHEAAANYNKMRTDEGAQLYKDLWAQGDIVEGFMAEIEARAPKIADNYAVRLEARMREILDGVPLDEARLMNEVAVFADKVSINEEFIRMRSHIAQLRAFLAAEEPVGRKLDFLMQEMNREINTIGSKANDLEIGKRVIDVKSAIEKLREQVQNVE